MNIKKYHLYALLKNENPIYVGVSHNIRSRINKHKRDKSFDNYVIIKSYERKEDALIAENAIIRLNTFGGGIGLINAKYYSIVPCVIKIKKG